ncbi:MAG: metallophosphoesterase [Chryseobacterium sp.]|nr:MAG: metallophosphoesterase [Chryseobacterium sp.]
MIKVLHISDTHGYHEELNIPEVDLIIHSGDCSNHRDPYRNEKEVIDFLNWYAMVNCPNKIYVPGNHDTSIEKGLVHKLEFTDRGIDLLINESIKVLGKNIWGSPITPTFGQGWAWNMDRDKLHCVWESIPDETDILVTHGPPKGVLDISQRRQRNAEGVKEYLNGVDFCGCTALKKRIDTFFPLIHMFGHIHDNHGIRNAGVAKLAGGITLYSNAAVMEDGNFDKGPIHNGNVFYLHDNGHISQNI